MKRLFPFLAYAALTLIIFWGVLLPPEGNVLFGSDITRYHLWQRPFLGVALREGQTPWWNPYTMMGVPYLEHPQVPVWYPPNLLFVVLPVHVAISWYIALHILIVMGAMYILSRTLGIGKLIAWGTGVAFGLSAYFVARIPAGHIDIIAASAWMPLTIMSNVKCQMSNENTWKKNCVIAAIVFAMQLLAGHPMVAVLTLEAVLIVTVLRCYFVKSYQPLFRTGMAVFIGLGIAAIQILPNAQYIARSIRTFPFPAAWAQLGTPTAGHMLEFIDPFYFYTLLPDSGFGFEHVGYIGKLPLLFAIIAVVSWVVGNKKNRWEIPTFVVVALFGLWMWLGSNAPIDLFSWVRSWFPLYSQIRIPARHIVLFVLSASILFGFGLSLVTSKILQLLVVGLVLVDLVPFARHHLSLVSVPDKAEDTELVSILTKDKSLYRFLPNFYHGDGLRDVLEFNAPIARRIPSVSGYDTPPIRTMYEFLLSVNGYQFADVLPYSESIPLFRAITSPYLNFLNVKYVLVPMGNDPFKTQQFVLVKENVKRGWRLYENKNVFPRFFIATSMQKVSGRDAVLAAVRGGSVDPATTVIIDGSMVDTSDFSPDCPPGAKGDVRVDSYGYGKISFAATTPCNAFLATSEVMYPGWTATIDGKPTPVFEGNGAFRALYLPRGTHTIVFSYRPMIVLLGAAISVATMLIVILFLLNPARGVL